MLRDRTWEYICKYEMIRPGDTILVGFSGGPDSVCLLLLLEELGKLHDFSVHAVHVNHNLRGAESDEDQRFAEEFCRERGIPIHCYSRQVSILAQKKKIGIEEAGRLERIAAFGQCRKETGAVTTALAHHKNDQAETVLFRLARGSSLAGLSGIRPVQGDKIHPLLFAEKKEIIEELERRGVSWRTDSSNLTDHYTRNRIRNQVINVLEEQVNEQSLSHIVEAAEDIAEAHQFLRSIADPVMGRTVNVNDGSIFVSEELLREPSIIQRYVLLDVLSLAASGRKDLGREQIGQLQDILRGTTGRKASLPGNREAVKSYGQMILRPVSEKDREKTPEIVYAGPGIYQLGKWQISCEIKQEVPSEIPEKAYTKWLDYDKIKDGLMFRFRKAGDFLIVTENGGRKKLKSYLIDEKIPADQRDEIPLLASGSRVFWVIGYRISEDCKITEDTKRVVKITVSEGK